MPANRNAGDSTPSGGEQFTSTHWSLVLAAGQGDSSRAQAALAELCGGYWYPLYAFARRQGRSHHDAKDLTQEFFARLLQKNFLGTADRERGRFRSFLLGAFKHFLADEWDHAQALKRGGGQPMFSLDDSSAEARYAREAVPALSAEKFFEQRWALTLLDQVMARLGEEYAAAGKAGMFEQLKDCLTGAKATLPYAETASRLATSEGAVKVAVHRLRRRYRELLRAEIACTVAGPDEVDDELRHLMAALRGQ